jgi:hypothetical protein
MARIQILELPTEHHGDDMVTPFVLVVDEYVPERYVIGLDQGDQPQPIDQFEGVAQKIGARAVLVFEETVEIPANEVPVDPDGYPLKIRVEGDFEQFRAQVQDEIHRAQAQMTQAMNGS